MGEGLNINLGLQCHSHFHHFTGDSRLVTSTSLKGNGNVCHCSFLNCFWVFYSGFAQSQIMSIWHTPLTQPILSIENWLIVKGCVCLIFFAPDTTYPPNGGLADCLRLIASF